jgi:apolipoprotein N-acyltransferase
MKFLGLSFLAGLVAALGFEPVGLVIFTAAGFAGLMWLVFRAPTFRSALARGWWFGVGHFTLGLNWIATAFTYQTAMPAWLGWIGVVLLSLYLAVYPAMAAGLAWRHGGGDGMRFTFLFAAAWIVTEWLRATMFTGFAWNPVGVTLLPTSLDGLAPLIGTYSLSGLVMLFAGGIMMIATEPKRLRMIPLMLALGAAGILGAFLGPETEGGPGVSVRIVQPNIGQQDKWREGFEERNLERLARLSGSPGERPRLLLWPEAAVTDPLQDERHDPFYRLRAERLRDRVARLLGPRDLLLTGGITFQSEDGARVTSATNSVFAMDWRGEVLGRYDKAHLVPFGEYLPARPILSLVGLSRLAPGDVDFDAGPGPRTIAFPDFGEIGFQICYEIIFSGHVVDPDHRPDFIFNPSNDAWFGAWGPPQHLAQARMRAIEEGLPVLRSTPTGISALIDSNGEVLQSIPWRTAGVIDARLPPPEPPTLFSRLGNLLPFLFALALVLGVIVGERIAARRKGR